MKGTLTEVQQTVLFAIHELTIENGYAPRLMEVANRISRSKTATVESIDRLKRNGWLRKTPRNEQGLIMVRKSIESHTPSGTLRIPVIGEVW